MVKILTTLVLTAAMLIGCTATEKKDAVERKGNVHFICYAPNAKRVTLAGEMNNWNEKSLPMTKTTNGFWEIHIDLNDGKWQYKYVMDGVWTADPNNTNKTPDGFGGFNSILLVGKQIMEASYDFRIDHGIVTNLTDSKSGSRYNVYLPPKYDAAKKYPLVFMLHGYGENEFQWIDDGSIANFMDNLIASGKISPFILAMPSGDKSFYRGNTEKIIMENIYPFVVKRYNAYGTKSKTAICGISMGGFGAYYLAHRHPELFGMCVSLSGYFDLNNDIPVYRSEDLKSDFKLLIYCGTNDTLCYPTVLGFVGVLKTKNVAFESFFAEGGHTWRYWNGISVDFLTRISGYFDGK